QTNTRLSWVYPRHYFSTCNFQFRPRQRRQVLQIRFPRMDKLVDRIDLLKGVVRRSVDQSAIEGVCRGFLRCETKFDRLQFPGPEARRKHLPKGVQQGQAKAIDNDPLRTGMAAQKFHEFRRRRVQLEIRES